MSTSLPSLRELDGQIIKPVASSGLASVHSSMLGAERSAVVPERYPVARTAALLLLTRTAPAAAAAADRPLAGAAPLGSREPCSQLVASGDVLNGQQAEAILLGLPLAVNRASGRNAVTYLTPFPLLRSSCGTQAPLAPLSSPDRRSPARFVVTQSGRDEAAKFPAAQPVLGALGGRLATAAGRSQRHSRIGGPDLGNSAQVSAISRFVAGAAGGSSDRACDGLLAFRLPVRSPEGMEEKGKQDGSRIHYRWIRDRGAARRRAFSQLTSAL